MTPVETLNLSAEPLPWNGLEEPLYEVVNGQKVELPPMGAFETSLSYVLSVFVNDFAQKQRLGKVVTEMLFRLAASPKLERRPDIAFVSYARWPRGRRVHRTRRRERRGARSHAGRARRHRGRTARPGQP